MTFNGIIFIVSILTLLSLLTFSLSLFIFFQYCRRYVCFAKRQQLINLIKAGND